MSEEKKESLIESLAEAITNMNKRRLPQDESPTTTKRRLPQEEIQKKVYDALDRSDHPNEMIMKAVKCFYNEYNDVFTDDMILGDDPTCADNICCFYGEYQNLIELFIGPLPFKTNDITAIQKAQIYGKCSVVYNLVEGNMNKQRLPQEERPTKVYNASDRSNHPNEMVMKSVKYFYNGYNDVFTDEAILSTDINDNQNICCFYLEYRNLIELFLGPLPFEAKDITVIQKAQIYGQCSVVYNLVAGFLKYKKQI